MGAEELPVVQVTQAELDALPEYSGSTPTGTTPRKRWKRDINWRRSTPPEWYLGEYGEHEGNRVPIYWAKVEIVPDPEGPR